MTIDLDKARAARREGKKKGPVVKLNRKNYELPIELPVAVLDYSAAMRDTDAAKANAAIKGLVQSLFDGRYEEFMGDAEFVGDIEALLEGVLEEYGVGQGESAASPES